MFYRKQKYVEWIVWVACMVVLLRGKNTLEETVNSERMPSPRIAITFDDGPSIYTERLLEGLKERGVKATFFMVGKQAETYPEIVQKAAEEGHLIGNHTYSHVDITKLEEEDARKEIEKTNQVLQNLTGKPVEYVRPPFGIWEESFEDLQMLSVMWTVDPLDWTTENVDEIVNKVVTRVAENDIILMHDCYAASVDAALRIVDVLQKQGYEFVLVEELLIE